MTRLAPIPLAALLLLGGCNDPEPVPVTRTAEQRGEALFSDPNLSRNAFGAFSCATCHSTERTPAGDRLLPGAPLDGAAQRPSFWGGQETDLLRSVDDCMRFFMLDSGGLDRSDPRAADLYAFLASLPPTQPAAAPFTVVQSIADIPVGDAARGEVAYKRACFSCHGPLSASSQGLGGASVLPDETIREHGGYGPLELRKTAIEKVRHGAFLGYAGRMPPFSIESLSDADLGDILSYLGFLP